MSDFIKVNYNTILNLSAIMMIERRNMPSTEYEEWNNMYTSLMKDVSEQYMQEHADDLYSISSDEMANSLYEKFSTVVKKHVEEEMGPQPEPFCYEYVIILNNDVEIIIDEIDFKKLCDVLNIDMDDDNRYNYSNKG